jgi:hypothetical protein
VLLAADSQVPASLVADVRKAVREAQGKDTTVVVGVFQNCVLSQPGVDASPEAELKDAED